MAKSSIQYYLLIDIGGTKLRTAVGDSTGNIIKHIEGLTDVGSGADGALNKIFELADSVIKLSGIDISKIAKAAVSFGGPVNFEKQMIIKSQHVKGWENYPLPAHIQKKYGIPTVIDNDGNVAALGEYTFGSGKGAKSLLYLTVSTGVGGGIILNGEIWHGRNNLAGEIGHIIVQDNGRTCECGKKGCVEAYASGYAVGKNAREYLKQHPNENTMMLDLVDHDIDKVTAITVYRAADHGDSLAMQLVDESIRSLGIAIANAISLLDVEKVVIGGGITHEKDRFFEPLQRYVDEFAMFKDAYHVPIVRAANKDEAGLKGTIALAKIS
jgi:glucokinase